MNNMKYIGTIILFLVAQLSIAQASRDVGSFTRLKVFNGISVQLIKSQENKVEISEEFQDQLEVINKNGTLHVRMALKKKFEGKNVTAKVFYKELIDIQANEGSYVSSGSALDLKLLSLEARHGSNIKLEVTADKLNIRSVTGATVIVSGEAKTMAANLGTGGMMKAKDLVAANATVNVSTGGQSDVHVTDLLEVTIKAGGEVTVYGNPKTIEEKITLGGTVLKAGR